MKIKLFALERLKGAKMIKKILCNQFVDETTVKVNKNENLEEFFKFL